MSRISTSPRFALATQWLSPTLFAIYVASVFIPWMPRSWQPPCNNTWAIVLHDAFVRRAAFGSDVVWTFGPYGFLYFGALPQTYALTLLGWGVISVGYGFVVWQLMKQRPMPDLARLALSILVTAVIATVDVVDAEIYAFAAFASSAWLIDRPRSPTLTVITGIAMALASLVKFSWLIAIVPCVLVISVYELFRERRPALLGIVYGASGVALWLAAGQSLAELPRYLSVSLEVTDGYAEAMQSTHPWGMAATVAYLAVTFPLVVLASFSRPQQAAAARVLTGLITYVLFVAFKAGFVRNDYHEVVAMATLFAVAVIIFCLQESRRFTRRLALPMLAASAALCVVTFLCHHQHPSFQHRLRQTARFVGVSDLARFLTSGIDPETSYRQDLASIAAMEPLNLPMATVDIYPWGGDSLLYAHQLPVHHRPIFESYSAYTNRLATLNQQFIAGTTSPEQLLFAVRSLDRRLPAMDDGLSWPDIITRYDIQGAQAGYLWMTRKRSPGTYQLTPVGEAPAQPNTAILVPEHSSLWMQADIPLTLLGRILKTVYKPPVLVLVIQNAEGNTQAFRFLPRVGATGFLLSPVIVNTDAFAVFHAQPEDTRLSALRVKAIALTGEYGFERCYDFSRSVIRMSTVGFAPHDADAK